MKDKVRHNARAILFDDKQRLVLFKRTKPNQPVYWATPGGHVETSDDSIEAALHRELLEELSATISKPKQIFLYSHRRADHVLTIEHFFLAKLLSIDLKAPRRGPEFNDAANGIYEAVFVPLQDLESINLNPLELKNFIENNKQALLAL